LLATTGFAIWVAYLVTHRKTLAWAAADLLLAIAALGLTIFLRWIPVYRGPDQPAGQSEGRRPRDPSGGLLPGDLGGVPWPARGDHAHLGPAHRAGRGGLGPVGRAN
jgi:hypothetical protein